MGITAKQFVRLLQKSGIIADEELAAWLKKNKSDDVKKLARKLIADEVLTRWQAKYIFGGKYKLKFGSYELLERSEQNSVCLLYTSPSPRDRTRSRMPSSA